MSSDMKVITGNFNKTNVEDEVKEARKQSLLEVIDEMRSRVEAGDMTEFVGASIDGDNEVNIHVFSLDIPGAVGLFEIGKNILLTSYEE